MPRNRIGHHPQVFRLLSILSLLTLCALAAFAQSPAHAAREAHPTWGVMNHVDAMHLRFDGETFTNFYLRHGHSDKARSAFARMFKVDEDVDAVFEQFGDFEDYEGDHPDYANALEGPLLAFPKELEGSSIGWNLLAELQEAQKKTGAAIKSMHRAVAIKPYAGHYIYLSSLYRSQRRYTEALGAANRAVELGSDFTGAHFERACSLARLGRKREALAALERMLELNQHATLYLDEPDLQPLSAMPEFQTMKDKGKQETPPR